MKLKLIRRVDFLFGSQQEWLVLRQYEFQLTENYFNKAGRGYKLRNVDLEDLNEPKFTSSALNVLTFRCPRNFICDFSPGPGYFV